MTELQAKIAMTVIMGGLLIAGVFALSMANVNGCIKKYGDDARPHHNRFGYNECNVNGQIKAL